MATPTTAAQLKEQGNALFTKKDFVSAHSKYTEAIALDGKNALLYANRSACSFGMGKYLEASRDALRATELDPTYAKGWSRLATAYDAAKEFSRAVDAWQKAVDVLPKENLTSAERQQKEQYTASLHKAQQRLEAFRSNPFPGFIGKCSEKRPWQVAEEMFPELNAVGPAMFTSSAFVIYYANQEFSEGVEHMKSLKATPLSNTPDRFAVHGHTSGLTCITNGVMRDMRVFHIDCKDWIDKFNGQVCFEVQKYEAWTTEGLEDIQKQALQRLKKKGWDDVRPALAVTVRARLMRAIFDANLTQAPHIAVERLKELLQLLHWGRQVWRDVSKEDRGVIFQNTFVRGIKAIYLETLMAAHSKATADDDKHAFLGTLLKASRELAEETEKDASQPSSSDPIDPGFVSSFYVYPAAEAYATIGYCFVQMARSAANQMEKVSCYAQAVRYYTQAAIALPADDEKYCWYLNATIDPMLRAGAPKKVVLGVVRNIREAMPKMQRIWANSALAKAGRDTMIAMGLDAAESWLQGVGSSNAT